MPNHAIFYIVWNVKIQLYAKGLVWEGSGGSTSEKRFLFSIFLIAETEFSTNISKSVLIQWEKKIADDSRVETTIPPMEK